MSEQSRDGKAGSNVGGAADLRVTDADLLAHFNEKYAPVPEVGWGPRLRRSFNYYTPDDHYETLMAKLITPGCYWAEIGCGRDIFPSNKRLAEKLSKRAAFLQGIDPDPTIRENRFLSAAFQGFAEDYDGPHRFDVVSLRMVAEHIEHPQEALGNISRIMKPGGVIVLYTPHRWAPMSVLADLVPHNLHHPLKAWLWRTEPEDTFPVQYKLNTRRDLRRHFDALGFRELFFEQLDDCRVFGRFRLVNTIELSVWRALHAVGLHYPETCLLCVYRKGDQ